MGPNPFGDKRIYLTRATPFSWDKHMQEAYYYSCNLCLKLLVLYLDQFEHNQGNEDKVKIFSKNRVSFTHGILVKVMQRSYYQIFLPSVDIV